jgi:hypothetical protein
MSETVIAVLAAIVDVPLCTAIMHSCDGLAGTPDASRH